MWCSETLVRVCNMKNLFKKTTSYINDWDMLNMKDDRRFKRQMKKIRRKQERSRLKKYDDRD